MDERTKVLTELGLSEFEAAVYVFLAREPNATGYKIARAIRKPVANTYKVLQALESKGAVLVDEGESRQYRAVPPEEFLARLEREFLTRRREATAALAGLGGPVRDDRVYVLRSAQQVIERASLMLRAAVKVAFLDAFPAPMAALKAEVAKAAARGVDVVVHTYEPSGVAGVREVPEQRAQEILTSLPGDHLSLVIDAREYLVAMLTGNGDGVYQAVWTQSVILAGQQHIGMLYEYMLAEVELKLRGDPSAAELRRVLDPYSKYFFRRTLGAADLAALGSGGGAARARSGGAGAARKRHR
jgi:sugar-specific transcriptional regulator TrmB